jgi:hypothetical protein
MNTAERKALIKRGEAALAALDLSVVTRDDHDRVDLVRRAMLALDDEQTETKLRLEAMTWRGQANPVPR